MFCDISLKRKGFSAKKEMNERYELFVTVVVVIVIIISLTLLFFPYLRYR